MRDNETFIRIYNYWPNCKHFLENGFVAIKYAKNQNHINLIINVEKILRNQSIILTDC